MWSRFGLSVERQRGQLVDFVFQTANQIVFGAGKIHELPGLVSALGRKVLLCLRGEHLSRSGVLAKLQADFDAAQLEICVFNLPDGEPTIYDVSLGMMEIHQFQAEVVIAIGGGSCIDTAKAMAALATNPGQVTDYLEGIGQRTLYQPPLPFVAVPTTAGTGAEATKNAVIIAPSHRAKKSMRSALLLPKIALLDAELTLSLPARITAETGMDALTQLIESYISIKAQPIPQALALHGIGLAGKYLRRAYSDGGDLEAREGMMLASLLSGMALANSGLGAAHGIAAALGAVANVPHGRACAMLLPHVMKLNRRVCIKGFADIYQALSGENLKNDTLAADNAVAFIDRLVADFGIQLKFHPDEVNAGLLPELVRGSRGS
ncbi:iron-containing alcohol dehydrogenase, partial [candidate division KSB1 bacterium]|nr:iron-containing alcohol dehydrogenase [candidate division KSB1 bacterium]